MYYQGKQGNEVCKNNKFNQESSQNMQATHYSLGNDKSKIVSEKQIVYK